VSARERLDDRPRDLCIGRRQAGERIEAVIAVLDQRQKPAFRASLGDALGSSESPSTP
jgi:hypothetical protein